MFMHVDYFQQKYIGYPNFSNDKMLNTFGHYFGPLVYVEFIPVGA